MNERAFTLGFGPDGPVRGSLDPDDLSLSYDAARGEVRGHPGGGLLGDDVFAVLEGLLDGDPSTLWVGWLGYACRPDLPACPARGTPDAVWMRARRTQRAAPVPAATPPSGTPPAEGGTAPDWYRRAFAEVQRQLRAGNSYEVNLTHRVAVESDRDPDTAYARLVALNPAPYAGHLRHLGTHLLGSSPERFATITGRRVVTSPIKGTTPRGGTAVEDARQRERLLTDPKIRAENLMVTDLLRNDLSQVCRPGTVRVSGLMQPESHPSVHQLVSTVEGSLAPGVSTLAALRAMFPAGSMTGAPKRRTMEVIDAVEATPRGIYAGAFGWVTGDGRADLGVVIRSLVRAPDGRWSVGTGGGVTVRSDVDDEWAEAGWKTDRLLAALK
ncbi:anthranilate synthase component I family protein [Nocardioides terrisoli]|uniref:anthranilate synthase component I family protein n=1 Tax=Nocardioides terrisoli TaxID=3388267 RepID=UPI00287B6885|nr:anthranilate synthase component I family protein [Nocardioides marmorisolisilvae]